MTETEFENERRFQGLMYFIRAMLRDGLIADAEFERASEGYVARLSPKTGKLLARNDLLYPAG